MLNNIKKMKKQVATLLITAGITAFFPVIGSAAGIKVYKDGDKYVKMGGRIHLQYHYKNHDIKKYSDSVFFRRLRPYIEGSIHKNWKGKFQWDMGKASGDNEVSIKDAYMQYKGFDFAKITIGNQNFPFSREILTSSKKTQLVERTFVGDHNYGSPARNLAARVSGGTLSDEKVTYDFAFASASIDPDSAKLDFDTPVNASSDFNQ